MGGWFIESALQEVGEEKLSAILVGKGLPDLAEGAIPFAQVAGSEVAGLYAAIQQALRNFYGRGARGLLLRIGHGMWERLVGDANFRERAELEIIRHPGASAVVPLLSDPDAPDPTVLLIRQFRHAAGGFIWEIPAGVLEPGETPERCARRELEEETGATAERIEHLATVFTTPGFTDERIHLFVAHGIRVGEPNREHDEFMEVKGVALSEVLRMIRDGDLVDAKSVVAVLYLAGFRLGM